MSYGIAVWSVCCLLLSAYLGIYSMISCLADGEYMAALCTPVAAMLFYLFIFHVGVLVLNVLGVASDVLDVNVKESRRIRGKE